MQTYRGPFLVVIMTISLFFYMYLNPPFTEIPILDLPFPGDISAYLSRFMLSFIFMGLIPFVSALVLGLLSSRYGINLAKEDDSGKMVWGAVHTAYAYSARICF